jgi:uridine phosphorylase
MSIRRASSRPKRTRKRILPNSNTIPLLEHDSSKPAIIEPGHRHKKQAEFPLHCVLCFFQDVIDDLVRNGAREIDFSRGEGGRNPIYEVEIGGKRIVVVHPLVGAPMAASMLERCIARGARKFIACGGAGVLDSKIAVGHIIVPTAAIRDEGTSYHYLPPSREVMPHPRALRAIESVLSRNGIDYVKAKTWTTDGFYRETRNKLRMRRDEGCLTVEMEASAFFAVAQFRRVILGQILYGGDDLGGKKWDQRDWMRHQSRERVFQLAVEACLSI